MRTKRSLPLLLLLLAASLPVAAQTATVAPGGPQGGVGATQISGCNPPLPGPGETVTWVAAMNPVQICQPTTIPAGGTVVLGPGVHLEVQAGVILTVEGELLGNGTAANPLLLDGDGTILVRSTSTIEHAHIEVNFDLGSRAALHVVHAVVPDGGDLSSFQRDSLLDLQHVVVETSRPTAFSQLALRDVTFLNPNFPVSLGAYLLLDGLRVYGSPLEVVADFQPRRLSDVDVFDPGPSPCLSISGGGVGPGTNALIEGDCDLVGGSVPVELRLGGLHPASVVPTTGNTRNVIDIGGFGAGSGVCDWPALDVPYYLDDNASMSGRVTAGPGARFLLEPAASIQVRGDFFNDTGDLRGAPGRPLQIEPATPGGAAPGGVGLFNATAQHIVSVGSRITSTSGFNAILECTVRDSEVGIFGDASATCEVRGCRLLDNQVGAEDDPSSSPALDLRGTERANWFEGNVVGALNNSSPAGNSGPFPAQDNWWGHPSGPASPWINPEGQGDPIGFGVEAAPWLTAPPDLDDTPPFVTQHWPFLLAEPGDWLYVSWDVQDDGRVVSQRIRADVSGGGSFQWVTLADGLAADRRAAIVQVPSVGLTGDARSTYLRVEATDDAGNVGRHDITLQVPVLNRPDGNATFRTDTKQGFVPGEEIQVCYDALGVAGSMRVYLVLDTEDNVLKQGPSANAGLDACTLAPLRFPRVSTNRARFALFADGVGNDNDWYFSEPFEIRPHPEFPDRPPVATLQQPVDGQRFQGGDVVSVSWFASDDEGLDETRVQLSLNDGRTWTTIGRVPSGQSWDWTVPPVAETVENVRLRVVVTDHRFQSTAAGDERVFALDPGPAAR